MRERVRDQLLVVVLVYALGVFLMLGVLATWTVWSITEAYDAPRSGVLRITESGLISQVWQPTDERLAGVLLKAKNTAESEITVEIVQGGNSVVAKKGLATPVLLEDWPLIVAEQVDNEILRDAWLYFPLKNVRVATDMTAELRIGVPKGREISLTHEHDNSRHPGATLIVNGRERLGNIGMISFYHAGLGDRLMYQLFDQNAFQWLVIWLLVVLMGWMGICSWRRKRVAVFGLFGVIALAYTLPLYEDMTAWGQYDWQEAASYYAAVRHSISNYQWPHWNPYLCGGTPLWADPLGYMPSIGLILSLFLGPVLGTKLATTIAVFIGLSGFYSLMRALSISREGSLVGAMIFMLNGHFAAHIATGHMLWLSMGWIPWILYCLVRAFEKWWFVVPAGALFAWLLMAGPAYFPAYTLVLASGLVLALGMQNKALFLRSIVLLGLFIVMASGLSAVKLLPMLHYTTGLEGHLIEQPGLPITQVWRSLVERNHDLDERMSWSGSMRWREYQAYIGIVPLLLSGLGLLWLVFQRTRRGLTWGLLGLLVLFGSVMVARDPAFNVFEYLPLFNQLHSPARAQLGVLVVLAIASGYGIDALGRWRRGSSRVWRSFVVLGVVLLAADYSLMALDDWRRLYLTSPQRHIDDAVFRHVRRNFNNGYRIVEAGYGALEFCPPHARNWRPGVELATDKVFIWKGDEREPVVEGFTFTPNRIVIPLQLVEDANVVLLNQRYAPGWFSEEVEVRNKDGLLAFDVPRGAVYDAVVLRYRSPWFVSGVIVSVGTLMTIGIVMRRRKSERLEGE